MMKKLIAITLLLIYAFTSFACSTFLLSKDGRLVFGRNYDWSTGNGMMVINARGVKKSSLVPPGEKPITWEAQCGSITFNQFGKEFPHGGMNESGLVVELMWLVETVYPEKDERAALNELQWIQYQLDNFTTVDDVIASNKNVRINPQGGAPLHYLVSDAQGNAATIEFINGKMVVHQGKNLPYPVLTNTIYSDALRQSEAKKGNGIGNSSVNRFATACHMVQQFQQATTKENPVDYAFNILDKIAQGNYTKWRIVYDITNKEISFITNNRKKQVSFDAFDFDCTGTSLFIDLNGDQEGNVNAAFAPLSYDYNKMILEKSALQSGSALQISPESLRGAADYIREVKCN